MDWNRKRCEKEMVVVGKLLLGLLERLLCRHIGIWLIIAGVRSPWHPFRLLILNKKIPQLFPLESTLPAVYLVPGAESVINPKAVPAHPYYS